MARLNKGRTTRARLMRLVLFAVATVTQAFGPPAFVASRRRVLPAPSTVLISHGGGGGSTDDTSVPAAVADATTHTIDFPLLAGTDGKR